MRTPTPLRQKGRFGRRNGNVMVESAFCFLPVMLIFFAIMDFGMGIYAYNFVSYAAREGSRFAASRGAQSTSPATADSIRDKIQGQAIALDTTRVSVATTWNPNNTPGNTVTVNVSYRISPLIGLFLGNITVGASSTMPIAQ